jgi:mRNA interferase MazF
MIKEIKQNEVFLVNLDPTEGSEMSKTRPCVILSPDEMNKHLQTVIIAPLTKTIRNFPSRVPVMFDGKNGMVGLDHIRSISKNRIRKYIGKLQISEIEAIKKKIKEIFCD